MVKAIALIIYLFVISGFIFLLAPTAPALAQGGYEGLIAPAAPETSAPAPSPSSAPAADTGYSGLLAPAPAPAGSAPAAPKEQQPAGYSGLIPGYVGGGAPAQQAAPVATKASDDLKAQAAAQARDRDGDGVLDGIKGVEKASAQTAQRLEKPRQRIQNMLPMEYAARQNIDQVMAEIKDKKLHPDKIKEKARKAHESLERLADGVRFKKMVPDKTYRDMGLPDIFIREEKEGNEKALALLNQALAELKGYE